MKKYNIFGTEVVKLSELKYELRRIRRDWPRILAENDNLDRETIATQAINCVVRSLFREEFVQAKTNEERKHIIEMPGEFIVCKSNKGGTLTFFSGIDNDNRPIYTDKEDEVLRFEYESQAEETAEALRKDGGDWTAIDMSDEEGEFCNRFFRVISKYLKEEA